MRGSRAYWLAWALLLALLAATFGLAHVRIGSLNAAVSLAIAAAKAVVVALAFMHLRRGPAAVVAYALVALFMLSILFGLGATDFAASSPSHAPWVSPNGP